ncbi:EamA family transporter RarD [Longispora albida]|uniref:EamA family transporter RarD n=1 Tax=Longispora albida TaxID=203523 RepID=UPI000373D98A|nr:EamA family transporter RarD [Longispora albida]
MDELRRGYLFGVLAYGIWGAFPLYWRWLSKAGPVEILAHRVVWSAAFVTLVLLVTRHWGWLRKLQPRVLGGITLCALLLTTNWGFYIYGVNTHRVVETSLGYFITPLVNVLLGVLVLSERLRPWQWFAIGVGALAVGVLTYDYGHPPYIAIILAVSFGSYGLLKKRLGLPAAEGLFIESAVVALPALAYLAWVGAQGESTLGQGAAHTALLIGSGVATAVPLMLFAGAANRLPLSAIGMLQYIAPVLQLSCGVFLLGESLPPLRLAGFALVWLALAVFTLDGIRHVRRAAAARAAEPAPATK